MKVLIEVDPNRLVGVLNLAAMALADPRNKDAFLDDFDTVVTARNEAKRWHKYPDEMPSQNGDYIVALFLPDGDCHVDLGTWSGRWGIDDSYEMNGARPMDAGDCVIGWLEFPNFPEHLLPEEQE